MAGANIGHEICRKAEAEVSRESKPCIFASNPLTYRRLSCQLQVGLLETLRNNLNGVVKHAIIFSLCSSHLLLVGTEGRRGDCEALSRSYFLQPQCSHYRFLRSEIVIHWFAKTLAFMAFSTFFQASQNSAFPTAFSSNQNTNGSKRIRSSSRLRHPQVPEEVSWLTLRSWTNRLARVN